MNPQAIFDTSRLEHVREGMAVIDESGVRLGTVERVRMGEPDAVTTGGAQEDDSVGVAVAPANSPGGSTAFGGAMPVMGAGGEEAEVPDPLRTRLRRVGFIEVDGSDLHGADRYIPGDRVCRAHAPDCPGYAAVREERRQPCTSVAVEGSCWWKRPARRECGRGCMAVSSTPAACSTSSTSGPLAQVARRQSARRQSHPAGWTRRRAPADADHGNDVEPCRACSHDYAVGDGCRTGNDWTRPRGSSAAAPAWCAGGCRPRTWRADGRCRSVAA